MQRHYSSRERLIGEGLGSCLTRQSSRCGAAIGLLEWAAGTRISEAFGLCATHGCRIGPRAPRNASIHEPMHGLVWLPLASRTSLCVLPLLEALVDVLLQPRVEMTLCAYRNPAHAGPVEQIRAAHLPAPQVGFTHVSATWCCAQARCASGVEPLWAELVHSVHASGSMA